MNADHILGGWIVKRRDQRWNLGKGKRDVCMFRVSWEISGWEELDIQEGEGILQRWDRWPQRRGAESFPIVQEEAGGERCGCSGFVWAGMEKWGGFC